MSGIPGRSRRTETEEKSTMGFKNPFGIKTKVSE